MEISGCHVSSVSREDSGFVTVLMTKQLTVFNTSGLFFKIHLKGNTLVIVLLALFFGGHIFFCASHRCCEIVPNHKGLPAVRVQHLMVME